MCLLSGCLPAGDNNNFAPVVDLGAMYAKQKGYYIVQKNETLYLIAWRLDMDFHQLAALNNIKAPYQITLGQRLTLGTANKSSRVNANITEIRKHKRKPRITTKAVKVWLWPAKGKVVNKFSVNNKGINIVGSEGEPVRAAASGEVVYAGNGLSAYGNLIIIKHNSTYLSAYAHNKDILTKEGAWVKQGQTIAHMGNTGNSRVMLHFEIRKFGKPVNPLIYLH